MPQLSAVLSEQEGRKKGETGGEEDDKDEDKQKLTLDLVTQLTNVADFVLLKVLLWV